MPSRKQQEKEKLLDSIEECINLPLDNMVRDMRGRLKKTLPLRYLRAVERGVMLAYQEGYNRGRLSAEDGDP